MRNKALYLALSLSVRVLPLVPVRLAHLVASVVGRISYHLFRSARQGIQQNLQIALPDRSANARKRIARQTFRNDALNWVDTLRIPSLSDEEICRLVHVHGWEHLESALRKGKGLILVSMHLGNFDLVGQVIAARGWHLTVPVEHIEPPELFAFLSQRRGSRGIHLPPVEEAARALLWAINRGEIAGLTADRHVAGKSITVDFFGRPAMLPRGPASLARHTGAPILVGIGVRHPSGGFEGFITAPNTTDRTADAIADEERITEAVVSVMEDFVRRYPEQWLAFSPIWSGGMPPNSPATIGQQTGAAV